MGTCFTTHLSKHKHDLKPIMVKLKEDEINKKLH